VSRARFDLADLVAENYGGARPDADTLLVGDWVKAGFVARTPDPRREWMWLVIVARNEDSSFIGELRNEPLQGFAAFNDHVRFQARHVLTTMSPEEMAFRQQPMTSGLH